MADIEVGTMVVTPPRNRSEDARWQVWRVTERARAGGLVGLETSDGLKCSISAGGVVPLLEVLDRLHATQTNVGIWTNRPGPESQWAGTVDDFNAAKLSVTGGARTDGTHSLPTWAPREGHTMSVWPEAVTHLKFDHAAAGVKLGG
jgi:hypothetical protein